MMWRRENSSYRDWNFDLSVVRPVASRYTDYAIAVHKKEEVDLKIA
jgi:hypothetical protein